MKKVIAFFLTLSLIISLSACKTVPTVSNESVSQSESLAPEDGAELIFWTADVDYGKALAERFKSLYGITVNVEEVGLDGINKMILDGPAGKGADIFMAANDMFQTGLSAGLFLELDAPIATGLEDQLHRSALQTVEKDGHYYGVPVSIETSAILYNKDLVKGEPATTFEQIVKEAKTYNDPAENKFWFTAIPTSGYSAYPFLSAAGYQLFGADGLNEDQPGFDTPEFVKGLQAIAELKEILPIPSGDLTMDTGAFLDQLFIDGKTAYLPAGPWTIQKMKDAKVNFGITTLPTYQGNVMRPFGGVQTMHVSAYSEYPAAAQLFAQFSASVEGAEILYQQISKLTARKNVSEIAGLKDDEIMMVFAKQFETAAPMPSAKRMSYYWQISDGVLSAVFDGTLTPEDGAKKAQTDFDALVASE